MKRRFLELLYRFRILKRPIVMDYLTARDGVGHLRLLSGSLKPGTVVDLGPHRQYVVGEFVGNGRYTVKTK